MDSLRRRKHVGPVSQQFASRRSGTGIGGNNTDEQQRGAATEREQHAAVQAQPDTGTRTRRVAQPQPHASTEPWAQPVADSIAEPDSKSNADTRPDANAEPIARSIAVRKLPRRRSPSRAPP